MADRRNDGVTPAPTLRRRDQFDTYDELLRLARRRLPRPIYEEFTEGPDRGMTARGNVSAFSEVMFHPRSGVVIPNRDLRTTVLGREISMPVILAPVGPLRSVNSQAPLMAARAANGADTICALSHGHGDLIEQAAAETSIPLWQQMYMSRGREGAEELIRKAAAAGFHALVVTIDSPIAPKRSFGFINTKNARRFVPDLLVRPGWTWRFLRDGLKQRAAGGGSPPPVQGAKLIAEWKDFSWIREAWPGPIIAKGIVTADDARRAIDAGAAAVVVSNHGGVGLDGTVPTLRALPKVVHAVDGEIEVFVDGGVRQGTDVVKAIALGAKAVLIGRPYVMGAAVAGEAGVRHVLENFRYEISRTLGLLGVASIADVDRSLIEFPAEWAA